MSGENNSTFQFGRILMRPGILIVETLTVTIPRSEDDQEQHVQTWHTRPSIARDGYSSIGMGDVTVSYRRRNCKKALSELKVCCSRLFLLLWILASIYLIVTGVLLDCPVEPKIATFAIVQGGVNLGFVVWLVITVIHLKVSDDCNCDKFCSLVGEFLSGCCSLAFVFSFIWIIIGSLWVWGSIPQWFEDHNKCNSVLYIGAMVYLCFHYLIYAFLCCVALVSYCCD